MQCKNHPKKEASAVCVECGKPVCRDCDFVILRKRYCKECATKWLRDVDEALKLEIPEAVTCDICGRARGASELFYVCESCGAVACPTHWSDGKEFCQTCYDEWLAGEVEALSKTGLMRPCPFCGTENTLDAAKCRDRSCEKPLPRLKDAEDIRRQNVPCENHPQKPAYVQCVSCGKYLCLECQTTYKDSNYCVGCLNEKKTQEEIARKKRIRVNAIITASSIGAVVLACFGFWLSGTISERREAEKLLAEKYSSAQADYRTGRYESALASFVACGDYKDAQKQAEATKGKLVSSEVAAAEAAEDKGNFEGAAEHYVKATKYDPTYDARYRGTRVKAGLAAANIELTEAKTLLAEISISNAAEGGEDLVKLNVARDKTEGAIKRLNETKEMAPDNADVVALLAVAETERDRLNKKSEKIQERRGKIKAAEERRLEAERKAEEARERRAAERAREEAENYMVYVTATGSKYHSGGCRYLRKSCIPMRIKRARASGYSP